MKRLLIKHWPLVGIGGLLIVVCLYLLGADYNIEQDPSLMNTSATEGLKLKNIHYSQSSPDDQLKWTLDAKDVQFSQDRQRLYFTDFLFRLEPRDRPSVKLEGKRGDYDKNSGEINLQGNLRGYTDNGFRIITEHILVKQKEGILQTEGPVKIIGPEINISGKGLYFNLKMEILQILSGVTTLVGKGLITL
ncbi:MAG: LPS export ABC transporter periplasmic protein LptC [Pseudomonadota bacterium]